MYDCGIVLVEIVGAVLIVLRDSGVVPLLIVYCSLMFFPPNFARAMRLADVYCFVGACACVFVDSLFFLLRCVCFVLAA